MMPDDRLPEHLAAMLAVERSIPPPPPDAIARVHARLRVSVSGSAAGTSVIASKPLLVLGAVAVMAGAGLLAHRATRGDPRAPGPAPSLPVPPSPAPILTPPAPILTPPAPAHAAIVPDPSPPSSPPVERARPAPHRPRAALAAPTPPPPPRVSERELLERAAGCLARREAGCALAAVTEHAQLHAAGTLAEEREALWVETLVLAGDSAAARARARTFLATYPRSLYDAAIRRTLAPP